MNSMRVALEKAIEEHKKVLLSGESGLGDPIDMHVLCSHEATNKTTEKKSSEDQSRTSGTQCDEGKP